MGTSIAQEDFTAGRFIAKDTFVFIDYREKDQLSGVQLIDSGMYACIYLDGFDDEMAYAGKLKDYCWQNGYDLTGDYLCEVLTEFNVFDEDRRSMFLRLQVPVNFRKNSP